MAYKIEEIEGIGPKYAEKLSPAQIETTDDLLERCSSAEGRKEIAEKTGVSEAMLLKWANMADLMRISGIAGEYAELLEASGVDTIKELRNRKAENLTAKMNEVNESKKLTRKVPVQSVVAEWIEQSKTIDPRITH